MCGEVDARAIMRAAFNLGYEIGRRDALRNERELLEVTGTNVFSLDAHRTPIVFGRFEHDA